MTINDPTARRVQQAKAEALREAAAEWTKGSWTATEVVIDWLRDRADRIERGA